MKKLNLIIGILFLLIVSANSQVITKATESNSGNGSKIAIEKNKVIFCDNKTDTLTVEQLKECNKISILNEPEMEIISYSLVFRTDKADIYEHNGTGNFLPENVKEQVIKSGVSFFWLENITVKKGDTKLNIGTRKFYIKS